MDLVLIAVVIGIGLLIILAVPLLIAAMAQSLANMATDDRIKEKPGGFPVQVRAAGLRYAVLHHTGMEVPHFDLLFESAPGSPLMSWRSPVWPIAEPTQVERIADHRRDYLEYEGPVSGDRGEVRRVAGGGFHFEAALEDCYRIRIDEGLLFSIRKRADGAGWFVEVYQV